MRWKAARARTRTLQVGRPLATRGFTLLELLVVLVIMAMAATLAIPRFSQVLPGLELKRTAGDLAASLRGARGEAIRRNSEMAVVFGADVGERDRENNRLAPVVPTGIAVTVQSYSEPEGPRPAGVIRFFPDGSATGGVVTLTQDDRRLSVAVDWLTGAVRVQD